MAYKTDGTANFNFFINRQGPRGPQGIQGEEGFSPTISEGENTADTYTLRVTNKEGSFTTPNLKPSIQDRGGDFVKVDREEDALYYGDVDITIKDATTTEKGIVRLATEDDYTGSSEDSVVTPKLAKGKIDAAIVEANSYTDVRIKGLPAYVDLTSSQTIGGVKTFTYSPMTNGLVTLNNKSFISYDSSNGRIDLGNNSSQLRLFAGTNGTSLNINGDQMGNILGQKSIEAGDNVVITETLTGVKISSTGGISEIPVATTDTIGGIKVGENLSITEDGVLSATVSGGGTNAGLEGDYCSKYGIVDCPNGILTQSGTTLTLQAGVVMQLTENDGLTTNASAMTHTVTSIVDFDLFYTSGSLLEATQVVFAETEPDNGDTGVLAWFNGIQWQFKSNDTGNVWKSAPAVRLAHIHMTDGNITRIDYIGNRHLNNVIPVTTNTEQTIAGAKTFSTNIIINANSTTARGSLIVADRDGAQGEIYSYAGSGGLVIRGRRYARDDFSTIAKFGNSSTTIYGNLYNEVNGNNNRVYHSGNLVAGNNVEFSTNNSITSISVTGLDELQTTITSLQAKVEAQATLIEQLTARVAALEALIDGGSADDIYATDPKALVEQVNNSTDIVETGSGNSENITIEDKE